MAGYVLHLSTEENITLSSATVKRLIAGGSGDAALLYLAILHARGAADSGKLARELKWDETRLRAAEQALYEMKLVGAPEKKEEAPLPPPQQLSEPPEYTREDIARKLEGDGPKDFLSAGGPYGSHDIGLSIEDDAALLGA